MLADVRVNHGTHAVVTDRRLDERTGDAEFFDANAVITAGPRTGDATDLAELRGVAPVSIPPVLIGSGVTVANAAELPFVAGVLVVASALREEGAWRTPVSTAKTASLLRTVALVLRDRT